MSGVLALHQKVKSGPTIYGGQEDIELMRELVNCELTDILSNISQFWDIMSDLLYSFQENYHSFQEIDRVADIRQTLLSLRASMGTDDAADCEYFADQLRPVVLKNGRITYR
jgi:hypothetical protein